MRMFFLHIICWLSIVAYAQEEPVVESPPPIEATTDTLADMVEEIYEGVKPWGVSTDSILKENYSTNNKLHPKTFEPNFQEKYQDEEYDYTKTEARTSLWDQFLRYLSKILNNTFGYQLEGVDDFIEGILYLLAGIVLAVLIFFFIKYGRDKNGNWFFSKKSQKINPEVNPLEENIHEINFQQTIAQYEREKDYRSAIRYQFLWCLKHLSDNEKIDWHQKKTNSDYLYELKGEDRRNFEKAVYIFDHIWYGEFPIDEAKYRQLLPDFQPLKSIKK